MIVQCSWKVSDNRPVSDAVTWSAEAESIDLEDEIMVENCVMLEAPDKGDGAYPTIPACQLLLSCQPPNQISHVSVLCESRVIEVYGHHGEYLKTIKNELLEEAEDMVVFRGDVVLDKPLNLCSIKFVLLRSVSEMWLYGVKINIVKSGFDPQSQMTIPLAAVEQRLGEMGLALSDKAAAFKQLVEKFQNSSVFGPSDIANLIFSLQQSNLVKNKSPSPENSHTPYMQDSLVPSAEQRDNQNNLKEFQTLDTINANKFAAVENVNDNVPAEAPVMRSVSTSPIIFERLSSNTQTDEEYLNLEEKLKAFISEQVHELDKKIWEKINKRFQETEAKILCKLDEVESFVKPQGIGES
ncbi:uncharacterized protein LOC118196821 [Stegodyphus dumicola]|uniref:uncharacterized protein LOC118196821 n=1 Tax=Stegodyphus dumicola TaxID=202533 RepID=UPI0015AAFFC1|nr:uncharacterized protein LOC118196821 [Stegodyphus dumicola]